MTDYVKAFADTEHVHHRESAGLASRLRTDATVTDGVIRWNSNGRVPPEDCVALAAYVGIAIDVEKCVVARAVDTDKAMDDYRARRKDHKPDEEELHEMRAAFGEGGEAIDVVTGQTFKL